jgi:hypothetical protein
LNSIATDADSNVSRVSAIKIVRISEDFHAV